MLRIWLAIGLGGFIGSIGRYYLASAVQQRMTSVWPLGTFVVNMLGCLFIGFVFTMAERRLLAAEWRLFFATGLCGGFTTFSAFSLEVITLLKSNQWLPALTYIGFSLLGGLLGVWLGLMAGKALG